jgi:hypothetical protein
LGQNPDDARPHQKCLDLHLDQPGDGAGRVVGVDGGEHQVSGERRMDRDLGRLPVADLAHHDDVGILPQERTKRAGEGEADLRMHVHLMDAAYLVLDRIFGGQNVQVGGVDAVQAGIKGGGLAAAGRSGHENDAVGLADETIHERVVAGREAEVGQVEQNVRFVEQAHDDALEASAGRNGAHAYVDALARDLQRDASVLRKPLFRDVEPGHDLHARDNRAHELLVRLLRDVELAIDAVANEHLFLFRLDVNVARSLFDALKEERIDPSDDGSLVVGIENVLELLFGIDVVVGLELPAPLVVALVDPVDRVYDVLGARHRGFDRLLKKSADVVEPGGVQRIGAHDVNFAVILGRHQDPVRLGVRNGELGRCRGGDGVDFDS